MSLSQVLEEIKVIAERHGRKPPVLMAVSKAQPFEKMLKAYQDGQRVFGENYVQETLEKIERFKALNIQDVQIHFIGHLQSNKVKSIVNVLDTIHSVDSISLMNEIEKRAAQQEKKINIYFQINIDREETKGGFDIDELNEVVSNLRRSPHLNALGLMCVPDPTQNPQDAFCRMQKLSNTYHELGSGLSMGMSSDFEAAIKCGATVIRVGSKIFGARKYSPPK